MNGKSGGIFPDAKKLPIEEETETEPEIIAALPKTA